jgi:hypothetical protein
MPADLNEYETSMQQGKAMAGTATQWTAAVAVVEHSFDEPPEATWYEKETNEPPNPKLNEQSAKGMYYLSKSQRSNAI